MLIKNQKLLSGWGNFPFKQCTVFRPERTSDVDGIYMSHSGSVVARGGGMSYGDASLNREGVVLTKRLNKFVGFDKDKGVITVQPGVTLAEILEIVVPYGWFLPVIPGTKYASIGGCVAANVHGKNEYKMGELGLNLAYIKVQLPSRKVVKCTAEKDSDIYWATLGGMGMTGLVVEVAIKLMKISSANMRVEAMRVPDLAKMLEKMRKGVGNSEYMVGWIDHFGKGKKLGRGVFERASHVKKSDGSLKKYNVEKKKIKVPFFLPAFVLNKFSMYFYNLIKFSSVGYSPQTKTKGFNDFFHPLDSIEDWNKLYGKRGFLQYQCLVPEGDDAYENIKTILKTIQDKGLFSFLAVIKYHGPRQGLMSFSKDGFSLALDFPNTPAVHVMLDEIDEFLCEIGGRVYLAKDARLKPSAFEKMYAHVLPEWRKMLKQIDPKRKIHSSMERRLGFKEKH